VLFCIVRLRWIAKPFILRGKEIILTWIISVFSHAGTLGLEVEDFSREKVKKAHQ